MCFCVCVMMRVFCNADLSDEKQYYYYDYWHLTPLCVCVCVGVLVVRKGGSKGRARFTGAAHAGQPSEMLCRACCALWLMGFECAGRRRFARAWETPQRVPCLLLCVCVCVCAAASAGVALLVLL